MNSKTKSVLAAMITAAISLGIATIAFFVFYYLKGSEWMLTAAVTFLTVFYHFAMRLATGEAVTAIFRGREFPQDRAGFRMFDLEEQLYRALKVKKWKLMVITAKPEQFDLKQVSPEELLHNVMQAELVHRIIMLLSFVPLLFIIPFGEPLVFICTSVFACAFDSIFVIIQRYNRPRVIRYMSAYKRQKMHRKCGNIQVSRT